MRDLQASIAESARIVTVTADTLTPGPECTEFGMVKTAADMDRYRHVIDMVRPDGIIEIGTLWGTSAVWFAETAGCPVISVDPAPQVEDRTRRAAAKLAVEFWTGRSVDPDTVSAVEVWGRQVRNPLVVLDGDHSAQTVLAELDLYSSMVAPGGYVVVEDGLIRWTESALLFRGCPLDAVEAWLPSHPDFEIDMTVEDLYPTTQFPSGWLKRKKTICLR